MWVPGKERGGAALPAVVRGLHKDSLQNKCPMLFSPSFVVKAKLDWNFFGLAVAGTHVGLCKSEVD